jgi:integrase/recombinase XerD
MKELENYLQQHYTNATAKAYIREIEIYLLNFPKAETAVYKDVTAYIGSLRNRYSKPQTLSRILSSIKVYYAFLCFTAKRKDNPAKAIYLRDKISRDIQLQDLFTAEELETLLNRKERFNALEYRNKVLVSLLIYQALHPRETASLTIDEINLEAGTVYIKATPKTNSRTLQLKPKQIMLFHQYITAIRPKLLKGKTATKLLIGQRGEPVLREDITKHIKRSYKGLFAARNVNAQTIRQSVITNLLKHGHDLSVVQQFAGHKYPSTTERYKQSNTEALKTAIQQYHPFR